MGLGADAKVITFIHTRDPVRSKAFYIETLGFPLIAEDPFATVIDLNGVPLRIVVIEDHKPNPHTILGWDVDDIEASLRALNTKGVKAEIYNGFGQDALGIWSSPDGRAKVAWFLDPDGNNLSLTQRG